MIVFVNGAFGIGKTAVARALVERIPGALLFDPELIGIPLQRAARLFGKTVDFQDLASWRSLTVGGLRAARAIARTVVVPMAFSNRDYLGEIRERVAAFDPAVFHFCLTAPVEVVHDRLRQRGADPANNAWEFRRAAECCAVHGERSFAQQLAGGRPHADGACRADSFSDAVILMYRLYGVLPWGPVLLGLLHMSATWWKYDAVTPAALWFLNGGIVLVIAGLLNLVNRKYGAAAPGLRWLCQGVNVLVLCFATVSGIVTGAGTIELVIIVGVLAAITVLSFARTPT